MQQNGAYSSATTDCNPGWAVPTYDTDIRSKAPPPSYFSVVNQQDPNGPNQNFGTTYQPHVVDRVAPDQTVIIAPAPRPQQSNTGRNVGVIIGIGAILCFVFVIRIIVAGTRYSRHQLFG